MRLHKVRTRIYIRYGALVRPAKSLLNPEVRCRVDSMEELSDIIRVQTNVINKTYFQIY